MFWSGTVLLLGLLAVVKGADYLLDGAITFARRYGIPDLIVGLTLVAFGTSLPELVINVLASFRGNPGIILGNIIGSNVANILLILGITAVISPIKRHLLVVKRDVPFNLALVVVLILLALSSSRVLAISRGDGLVLLSVFAFYLWAVLRRYSSSGEENPNPPGNPLLALLKVLLGSAALGIGSNWTLEGAIGLARALNVSEVFVGLFVVAVGTSLPELATSVLAALRGNPYIALGNISGSNVFNIGMILGLSATIRPIPIPSRGAVDMLALLAATSVFLMFSLHSPNGTMMDRRRGLVMLLLYGVYIATSFAAERSGLISSSPLL